MRRKEREKGAAAANVSPKLHPGMSMTLPLVWLPTQCPLEAVTTTTTYSYHLTESCGPYFVHMEGETHQDAHTDSADHAYNIVISHTILERKLQDTRTVLQLQGTWISCLHAPKLRRSISARPGKLCLTRSCESSSIIPRESLL